LDICPLARLTGRQKKSFLDTGNPKQKLGKEENSMISPEMLRRYPSFKEASDETLKVLAMNTDELIFDAGETLFREDQAALRLYIVTHGEVDIQYVLNTDERRTVDTRVPGDLLLWSAVVKPFRTTASAVARSMTKVLAVDVTTLRALCEQDHDLDRCLMREIALVLSQRLQGARVRLATVG
jgi:CRP-like cAMP-binding protein